MFKQFFRFGVVGLCATFIHILVFSLGVEWFKLSGLLANFIAFICAFIFSFAGHFYWTFSLGTECEVDWESSIRRFLIVALFAFLINSLLAFLIVDFYHQPYWIAALLMGVITPSITFILSKFWAFNLK